MTATDRIRAAIHRCIEANPEPSDGSDIAAAVLQEAAEVLFPEKQEPIEPIPMTTIRAINHAEHWSAWCALKAAKERLQALAQELNGTDYGNHIPDARKMVSPADALVARARAALAAEPVAAPARPTDEELALIYHDFCRGCEFMDQGGFEDAARAALARYTHQPAPAAEGEVAELVKTLRELAYPVIVGSGCAVKLRRAADLLEQRHPAPAPAAEGEEPEVVALARPTDAQLIEEAIAVGLAFQPQDEVSEVFLPFDAEEPLDDLLVNFARAVLARYGHRPAPPAEGEAAELVAWLRETGDQIQPSHLAVHQRYKRAAALLEQRHPTPVPAAEREVQ